MDVRTGEPLQTFKHGGYVLSAQFNRDESRVLTSSGDKTARLWDVTKSESLQTFKHNGIVSGAQFSRDESRVLTWSEDRTARLWDATDHLAVLTPEERVVELEVRSGATLNTQLNLRTLTFDEWQARVKSAEYRTIEQKLAIRPLKPEPQVNSSSDAEALEKTGASSPEGTKEPSKSVSSPKESRVRLKRATKEATGSTNSAETNWFGVSLLGFMGIVLLVVFARKSRDRREIE